MIDLKLVQKQPEVLAKALADRHSELDVNEFLSLDARRRALLAEVESLRNRRNTASGQVATLRREGKDAAPLRAELGGLSDRIKELDGQTAQARADVEAWLMRVPNIPDASVPVGRDETENVEVARWGRPRAFDFPAREHGDLGTALGGLDFERAARLTGSRFVVSLGWAARLERALVNFFLDRHTRHEDYIEVSPPYMVNRATMTGTGQLPKFEEDLFKLREWEYYLIPTAEVPLTNLHAGEALDEADLPRAYCAATPCFRSEAGSAGKDTRGIIRVHQFNKAEMFSYCRPEDATEEHQRFLAWEEEMLAKVELPYRVIDTAAGDLGTSAARKFDCEAWLPTQERYMEVTSTSNCTTFQARRLGIRERREDGMAPVATLNGTLATTRWIVAFLENHQQADGSVYVPSALSPYLGGLEVLSPLTR